jgi:phage tail-like protein
MADPTTTLTSKYLRYLPAVLQEGPFIEPFLLGFEAILTGYVAAPPGRSVPDGLEKLLDTISAYFDPRVAPPDFLPWLSQWVALTLREDWSVATRRRLIAAVVPLYHLRGTKGGILSALTLCLEGRNATVTITEPTEATTAHYFEILLVVADRQGSEEFETTKRIVESVANQQKPAHTFYELSISYPQMQVFNDPLPDDVNYEHGIYVGKNTTLGSRSDTTGPAAEPQTTEGNTPS